MPTQYKLGSMSVSPLLYILAAEQSSVAAFRCSGGDQRLTYIPGIDHVGRRFTKNSIGITVGRSRTIPLRSETQLIYPPSIAPLSTTNYTETESTFPNGVEVSLSRDSINHTTMLGYFRKWLRTSIFHHDFGAAAVHLRVA